MSFSSSAPYMYILYSTGKGKKYTAYIQFNWFKRCTQAVWFVFIFKKIRGGTLENPPDGVALDLPVYIYIEHYLLGVIIALLSIKHTLEGNLNSPQCAHVIFSWDVWISTMYIGKLGMQILISELWQRKKNNDTFTLAHLICVQLLLTIIHW